MIIYVIRHGETNLNLRGFLQGQVDEPLNQKGIDLAIVTGKALADIRFHRIYTSPLLRARQTAELIKEQCDLSQGTDIPIIEDARLMEINFGDYEGKCILPGKENIPEPENFKVFFQDPFKFQPIGEGAESAQDVIDRTGSFWDEITSDPSLSEETILISMHGVSCRGMLNKVYEDKTDYWQGSVPNNCAVNIVQISDGVAAFLEKDRIYYDPALSNNLYG